MSYLTSQGKLKDMDYHIHVTLKKCIVELNYGRDEFYCTHFNFHEVYIMRIFHFCAFCIFKLADAGHIFAYSQVNCSWISHSQRLTWLYLLSDAL